MIPLFLGGHLRFNPTAWVQAMVMCTSPESAHAVTRQTPCSRGQGVQSDATIGTVGNLEWSLQILYSMILRVWMVWASCGSRWPQHPFRIFRGCCYGQVFVWNCLAPMHSLCLGVPLRWSMSCRCHTGSACRWRWYSCIYKTPVGLVFYRLQCRWRYNRYCLPCGLQVPSSYSVGLAFLWEVHVLGCPCVADATQAAFVGGRSDATWRCAFYCWVWAGGGYQHHESSPGLRWCCSLVLMDPFSPFSCAFGVHCANPGCP